MVEILLGTSTMLTVLLIGIISFWFGYRFSQLNKRAEQVEKKEPTEEQKRVAEGFANILNHTYRHSK